MVSGTLGLGYWSCRIDDYRGKCLPRNGAKLGRWRQQWGSEHVQRGMEGSEHVQRVKQKACPCVHREGMEGIQARMEGKLSGIEGARRDWKGSDGGTHRN